MTNSAVRRCRASMKNRSPDSPKGLRRPAQSRPTIFVARSRPCGDFAPSPTPWGSAKSTPWRRRPCAALRTGRSSPQAIEAESGLKVRVLSGAEEARFATFGVISGFFRPVGTVGDMGGGSLEIAEAIDDHVGDRWVSMPLGALPVEAMLSEGVSAAKRQIDEILRRSLPRELARPVFYPVGGGWRALAKAHMDSGRRAGQSRARLYAQRGRGARIRAGGVAAVGGETRGDAGRGGTPSAHFAGGGADVRSRAEIPEAGTRRLFRARPARGLSLFAAEPARNNISIR